MSFESQKHVGKLLLKKLHLVASLMVPLAGAIGCGHGLAPEVAPVPDASVTVIASSSTVRVGQTSSLTLSGNQIDVSQVVLTLSCQGTATSDCGSVTAGVYTAPAVVPDGGIVTVTATADSSSHSSVTGSVTLSILNPIPVLQSVTPAAIPSGPATLALNGAGFILQSSVTVSPINSTIPVSIASTYVSSGKISLQISTPSSFSGQLSIEVSNPTPGSATSAPIQVAVSQTVSYDAAVRFLREATYGPTPALITHVQNVGFSAFLDEQFAASPSLYNSTQWWQQQRFSIMRNAVAGDDQLRQRVSQTLSEIIVTSEFGQSADQSAFPVWINTLQNDAFGTYGQLLHDTLKLPALAAFLTNIGNNATNDPTQHVSQNLGRELLQLFSVGPYLLHEDGTPVVDGLGNPLPTYDNSVIDGVSRALTGWNFQQCTANVTCMWQTPLTGVDQEHDTHAKPLLNGGSASAGGSATQDLDALVSNIMQHPNVAPFVSRRLIQALVTSNPSPQYIARVAHIFQNDGTGAVGNLKAVVKAILLDFEARAGDDPNTPASSGHIQEPLLFAAAAMRGVGASMQPYLQAAPNGEDSPGPWAAGDAVDLETWAGAMGEQPLYAPSVFNFYSWQNTLPGTTTSAPEMQLETSSTVIAKANYINDLLYGYFGQGSQNVTWLAADASTSSAALVSDLNHYLLAGRMDATACNSVAAAVDVIPSSDPDGRIRQALYLFLTSPQYQVIQ